jgi:hypothetical protein
MEGGSIERTGHLVRSAAATTASVGKGVDGGIGEVSDDASSSSGSLHAGHGGDAEEAGWTYDADSKATTDGNYASIALFDDTGDVGGASRVTAIIHQTVRLMRGFVALAWW